MDTFKKKALALSALPLAFLFGAAFQSSNSTQLAAIQSQFTRLETKVDFFQSQLTRLEPKVDSLAANNKGPREFYLTRDRYLGDQALTACAKGYHMASLYEILDPTDLRYNTELGLTTGDSGFGPPTEPFAFGWIRTGFFGNGSPAPGASNCDAWTSRMDQGTAAGLTRVWNSPAQAASPWTPSESSCSALQHVWCVQD
jgi:hypothetical protein